MRGLTVLYSFAYSIFRILIFSCEVTFLNAIFNKITKCNVDLDRGRICFVCRNALEVDLWIDQRRNK